MRLRTPALALTAALALLAGCDTTNGGSVTLREVAGTYVITRLTFDPTPGIIGDVDVLAYLDSTDTEIRLFSDGDALFFIGFNDGETLRTDAAITAGGRSVRFSAITAQDAAEFARILLPQTFQLTWDDDDTLDRSLSLTAVDLDRFEDLSGDDRDLYEGLAPVDGTLDVRFERIDR